MIDASSTSLQPSMVFRIGSSKCPSVEYAATPATLTSKPAAPQLAGEALRPPLDEISAIGDAADDRIAPLLRIDGEFGRRDHVPDHVGPARRPRSCGSCRCPASPRSWMAKSPDLRHRLELGAHGRGRVAGFAMTREIGLRLDISSQLARRALQQVAAAGRIADQRDGADGGDAQIRASSMLLIFTHASVSGRRSGSGRVARAAGEGARLGGRGRHAGGADAAQFSRGRPRFPGVPASGHPRGIRARAPRAQDRARLSRIQRRIRARGDARGGSRAPRFDHQRHGAVGRRSAHRSVRRQARPRSADIAACVRGLRRGSGARAARGAIRGALRAARLSSGPRHHGVDASAWCAPTRWTRWWPSASGRSRRRRCASRPRACSSGCCATAARSRASIRKLDALFGVPQPARVAPGDRYRRAHADGARSGTLAERATRGSDSRHWCTTSARRTTPAGRVAEPSWPRGTQRLRSSRRSRRGCGCRASTAISR